jgi:hypothetical protein
MSDLLEMWWRCVYLILVLQVRDEWSYRNVVQVFVFDSISSG